MIIEFQGTFLNGIGWGFYTVIIPAGLFFSYNYIRSEYDTYKYRKKMKTYESKKRKNLNPNPNIDLLINKMLVRVEALEGKLEWQKISLLQDLFIQNVISIIHPTLTAEEQQILYKELRFNVVDFNEEKINLNYEYFNKIFKNIKGELYDN
jgi:hypothetical protein